MLHPLQRRWRVEDLMRRRRSDEERRYAAPQRSGSIDANPHQIEAVIFALSRIEDGGCILADEVGLGKTIEAGLVIAQLRAEGARRILLVTPKSLIGQWQHELRKLFRIDTRDGIGPGDGVFLVGREAAATDAGRRAWLESPAFDLVVIDEAHELFSGLHKRFDATGLERLDAKVARTAGRVFELVQSARTPVLLLTATPIQNSLAELWALVRFVDPNGTLLGDLPTFRQTFCDGDDRTLAEDRADELKRRIQVVLRRTLRRQAQEFLSRPFVERRCWLVDYPMEPEERALYEEVTAYMLSPRLAAFRGRQRRLLLLAFQRRFASSTAALAASLEKVAERLERMLAGEAPDEDRAEDLEDAELEDALDELPEDPDEDSPPSADAIRAELARVRAFIRRAKALGRSSKSRALVSAVRQVEARAKRGEGSGKMVIFTESIVTQEHIRDVLVEEGVDPADITLFRGTNEGPRAREALARWQDEVGRAERTPPRPDVAVRLALVHELATRSRIFVSTEAGAKGLNLQFAETVINYDLPWNPQRIEQRIGRCHRYGQTRDVTVVSFIAKDNEAERLMFELLARKLELFGTVLDASAAVLHGSSAELPDSIRVALASDFEAQVARIWQTAASAADVEDGLRALGERTEAERARLATEHARTHALIESYFDESVREVFAERRAQIPRALAELDRELEAVALAYLDELGVSRAIRAEGEGRVLEVSPSERLPGELAAGFSVAIGRSERLESLHLAHPLLVAAVEAARRTPLSAAVAVSLPDDAPEELSERRGGAARFVGVRVRHQGLECVDELLPIAVFDGDAEPISTDAARRLLSYPMRSLEEPLGLAVAELVFEDAVDAAIFEGRGQLEAREEPRYSRGIEQLDRYVEDRLFLLRKRRAEESARLEEARAKRDQGGLLSTREAAEAQMRCAEEAMAELDALIERLVAREDETYRRCRARLTERRYAAPRVERLFDVELVLE